MRIFILDDPPCQILWIARILSKKIQTKQQQNFNSMNWYNLHNIVFYVNNQNHNMYVWTPFLKSVLSNVCSYKDKLDHWSILAWTIFGSHFAHYWCFLFFVNLFMQFLLIHSVPTSFHWSDMETILKNFLFVAFVFFIKLVSKLIQFWNQLYPRCLFLQLDSCISN